VSQNLYTHHICPYKETALKALYKLGVAPAAELTLQSVLEEECTGNGTLACLVEQGYNKADAALIPEPFPFIVTAQLGVMWLRLTVTGRPAHVLDPSAGINAIEAGYKLYDAIRTIEDEWNSPSVLPSAYNNMKHPVNTNLGVIEGGEWPSSVPTVCTLDVRVGIPPGIKMEVAKAKIEQVVQVKAIELGVKHTIEYRGFQAEGCEMKTDWPMVKILDKSHQALHKSAPEYKAITCTTDARFFNLYQNIPTTCYGPEANAIHGIDESVSLESMHNVAKVFAIFISDWCKLERLEQSELEKLGQLEKLEKVETTQK